MLRRITCVLAVCVLAYAVPAAGETWDHLHLTVSDTAGAAEWYAKHFDGKVAKSGEFDAVWFGTNLVKFRQGSAEVLGNVGSAVDHIAFSVEDVKAKAAALEEDGAEIGAPNRRTQVVKLTTDPWGTKIELLTDEDLLGFHHVHLKTTMPMSTIDWYTTTFGGEATSYKDAAGLKAIRYDDMYVFVQNTLRAVASTQGRSVDHIGWRFKDFDATIKRLKALDVKFVVEPTKSGDHMIAFIEGPDGVKIEIVEATGE